MHNMSANRRDGHRTAVIGTDQIVNYDKDEVALSRHGIVNKPPVHEAYIVIFVEQPTFLSLDNCENKWYH